MVCNGRKISSATVGAGLRVSPMATRASAPWHPPVSLHALALAALLLAAAVASAGPAGGTAAAPPPRDASPGTSGAERSNPDPADTAPAGPAMGADEHPSTPQDDLAPDDMVPRWLEAVRAQRRALQERRRAQHQARRRALDPVGSARQQAMEEEFRRRRREMRDMIARDRWLFLNFGPWLSPLPTAPGPSAPAGVAPSQAAPDDDAEQTAPAGELPEWDNGWYFRGW